jgi:hypothetical protein
MYIYILKKREVCSGCLLVFFNLGAVFYVLTDLFFCILRTIKTRAFLEDIKFFGHCLVSPEHRDFFSVPIQSLFPYLAYFNSFIISASVPVTFMYTCIPTCRKVV